MRRKENVERKDKIIYLEKEKRQLQEETAELKKKNFKLKEKYRISKENIFNQQNIQPGGKLEVNRSCFRILGEDEIEKLEDLGSSGGGKVMKVAMKQIYALKQMIVNKSNFKNLQNFIQEYEIINMLDHPNVVDAIGIFMSNKNIPPSILLEYCPSNLQKAIEDKVFSKEEVVEIIYQIAEVMKFIHSKKIIHRDLKPTNILIGSDNMERNH